MAVLPNRVLQLGKTVLLPSGSIGGGCHLNRKVDALLLEAGFGIEKLKTTYLPGPRPLTYTYQGFAHCDR
jgi:hypothetical protein